MADFDIPHVPPIKFVKKLISSNTEDASVLVEFDSIPTLGMFIEAAAQSTSGIKSSEIKAKIGYLVTLKNVKLLEKPQKLRYQVDIHLDYKVENFRYVTFKIIDTNIIIANGSLVVSNPK